MSFFQMLPQDPRGQLAEKLGLATGQGIGNYIQRQQQQEQLKNQQGKLASLLFGEQGSQYGDVPIEAQLKAADIQGRSALGQQKLQQQQQLAQQKYDQEQQQKQADKFLEGQDYETVKNTFGDKFADLWKSSPQGGKTELLKAGIESILRGQNIDDLLSKVESLKKRTKEEIPEDLPQIKKGNLPDAEFPKFDERPIGYTPKEWKQEKSQWRKENSPIFTENKNKISSSKRDELGIKNLSRINSSGKLPKGLGRILIDPNTGELRPYAQVVGLATPEAQEFSKELARFSTRAKDAFGSRVTNFDLSVFMRQFPNLLNTSEGRERILRLMEINNKLDFSYQNALDKIYKKYGIGNIPMEKADELAQALIKDETEKLKNEYLTAYEGKKTVENLSNKGYKEGQTATNTDTGEKYIFRNGKWEKQ